MHIYAIFLHIYSLFYILDNCAILIAIMSKHYETAPGQTLGRKGTIFVKHYFENGNSYKACLAADLAATEHKHYRSLTAIAGNPYYDFFQNLKQDRVISISITAEKKRRKLWEIVELLTRSIEAGKTADAPRLLACIDILNRMDGHYVPVEVHSKQQIQAQTFRFDQQINREVKEIKNVTTDSDD